MTDFHKFNVPVLKKYLQTRGISCYLHRKDRLVKLCELAEELQLEQISPDDYKALNIENRTVINEQNKSVVLQSVTDIDDKEWSRVLTTLPDISQCDVFIYLMQKCGFTEDRLRNYKYSGGYKLYLDSHIHDVKLYSFKDQSFTYVRGCCIPEERQNDTPYTPWILVKNKGQIWSGGCSCVADNGTCKHVAALLFAVEDFSSRHKDRHTEVGTDVGCVWDKARKTSQPVQITELKTRGVVQESSPIEPTTLNYTASAVQHSDLDLIKQMKSICKTSNSNSVFLHSVDDSSDETESDEYDEPYTIEELAEQAVKNKTSFDQIMESYHDESTIKKIEEITQGQTDNPNWLKYRYGRLTASNFHSILHFSFNDNDNNYIMDRVLQKKFITTEAMKYGIQHEPIARSIYFEQFKTEHKQSKISECGMFVSKTRPYMGASPDGVISCKCCGSGLVEIKSSFSYKDMSAHEICRTNKKYHLEMDENNKVCLKRNSAWFTQIQGQMGVCGYKYCDFVFYTAKSLLVERIIFDEEFFLEITEKCDQFFHKYIVKAMCDKYI